MRLNRPEVNNACDGALIEGILAALGALERARGLRAVVVTTDRYRDAVAAPEI